MTNRRFLPLMLVFLLVHLSIVHQDHQKLWQYKTRFLQNDETNKNNVASATATATADKPHVAFHQHDQEEPTTTKEPKHLGNMGNVQHLFGFVIAGFAKCGTSTLSSWLGTHPDIRAHRGELIFLRRNYKRQAMELQKLLPPNESIANNSSNSSVIIGYKNPHDIQYPQTLNFFHDYAPHTKLILTVRHPVEWFESFYNFRLTARGMWSIKGQPNELVGGMDMPPYYPYALTGAFHRYLFRLGKTTKSSDEMKLLQGFLHPDELAGSYIAQPFLVNPVFLVDSSQLSDKNTTRVNQLRLDLQDFLELASSDRFAHVIPRSNVAKRTTALHPKVMERNLTKMDICDPMYLPIKLEMLHVARNASLWIRNYFLKSDDVFVSSPQHFHNVLSQWMQDPCVVHT